MCLGSMLLYALRSTSRRSGANSSPQSFAPRASRPPLACLSRRPCGRYREGRGSPVTEGAGPSNDQNLRIPGVRAFPEDDRLSRSARPTVQLADGCLTRALASLTSTRSARSLIHARSMLLGVGSADALRLALLTSARLVIQAATRRENRCKGTGFFVITDHWKPSALPVFSAGHISRGSKCKRGN